MLARVKKSEVPPEEMRGSGMPLVGTRDRTTLMLKNAWRRMVAVMPKVVSTGAPGVDTTKLTELWEAWVQAPEAPDDLLKHLEGWTELQAEITSVKETARAELQRRQDVWNPIAVQIAAWLPQAKRVQANTDSIDRLKTVADWLNGQITWLRNERFAPIGKQVQAVWGQLRQTSSVSLDGVELAGTNTRRRVNLSVSVDETEGAALAVMSQGELHALALSLFLPRATLPESPFRFIVIDDPVQAMDAARVDGLAMALGDVAQTHQVIVLTQDERLPEAVRRLGLPARVLEVSRQDHSRVSVRVRNHPVDDYIDDALAIALTLDYPAEAVEAVVSGLCRNAVEAACLEAVRRRQLGAGRPHLDVAELLSRTTKLTPRLALALWDDASRAKDVVGETYRRWGSRSGDCVKCLDSAAHEFFGFNVKELVDAAQSLAHKVLAIP